MATTSRTSVGDWQPSIKYLLVLLLVEIFLFGVARSFLNHGG